LFGTIEFDKPEFKLVNVNDAQIRSWD